MKSFAPFLLALICLIGAACAGSTVKAVEGTDAVLTHGPVVGAVTPNTARVFVRTSAPAQVQVQYGTDANGAGAAQTAASATAAAHDFTAQLELTDLAPNTTYYLNILVNGAPAKFAPLPSFKTFPPANAATDFSFVVLTDFKKDFMKPFPVETFQHAAQENPAFVIIGGDFDHRGPKTLDAKRQMFKDLYTPGGAAQDFVTQILDRFPVAHMWDDHDLGPNNADKTYGGIAMSLQVLQEFFPTYPLSAHGDYQHFSYGQTDFWLLDSRSQRDAATMPNSPAKSMLDGNHLGADGQLEWLLNGLKNSTATWKFVLTPVVFNLTHEKEDAWYGFRGEHNKIVQFIRDNHITGVIFISGDSHFGAIDDGTNAAFPEMIVPPANIGGCVTTRSLGTWSEGIYAPKSCPGYGVVHVTANPPQVTLEVKDQKGDTQVHYLTPPK